MSGNGCFGSGSGSAEGRWKSKKVKHLLSVTSKQTSVGAPNVTGVLSDSIRLGLSAQKESFDVLNNVTLSTSRIVCGRPPSHFDDVVVVDSMSSYIL